jgi:hypothetical protein
MKRSGDKMRIKIGTDTFVATLYNNATAAAFKSLLPMAEKNSPAAVPEPRTFLDANFIRDVGRSRNAGSVADIDRTLMAISRRSFLKTTGAALAIPATIRAQAEALLKKTGVQYGNQKNWFTAVH